MRTEDVEIYSDATNSAILRHPGRRFPGVLVQGDSLYSMCKSIDRVCKGARGSLLEEDFIELNDLRNQLWSYLTHYKRVLADHEIQLPFSEAPLP